MSEHSPKVPTPNHNSNWLHSVIVVALVGIGGVLIYRAISSKMQATQRATQGGCFVDRQTQTMKDNYMSGIIEKNEKYRVDVHYYDCNPVEVGDVVVYNISVKIPPVVKIVRGIEGDTFRLIENLKKQRYAIAINNEPFLYNGQPYYFGNTESGSPLEKHLNMVGQTIGPEQLLIFSYRPPGIQDSSTFGLVSKKDLIGKVLIEDKAKQERLANY